MSNSLTILGRIRPVAPGHRGDTGTVTRPCQTVAFELDAIAEALERDGFTVVDRVLDAIGSRR